MMINRSFHSKVALTCGLSLLALAGCGKTNPDAQPQAGSTAGQAGGLGQAALAGGTAAKAAAFYLQLDWATPPVAEAEVQAKLTFSNAQHQVPKTVSDVVFKPWMPAMGHGSSTKAQKIAPLADASGVFTVDHIEFIMGGAWEVHVTAVVDGAKDEAVIPVKVQ